MCTPLLVVSELTHTKTLCPLRQASAAAQALALLRTAAVVAAVAAQALVLLRTTAVVAVVAAQALVLPRTITAVVVVVEAAQALAHLPRTTTASVRPRTPAASVLPRTPAVSGTSVVLIERLVV